jgi:chromate transporter
VNCTDAPTKPSFNQALKFWAKLGFISFGGPVGQIAIMHEYLVVKMKWISDKKFMHALSYCMLLPGPEAQQLSIYTGWLLHGTWGGIVAGVLFVLPSMFILLALSIIYVTYGNIPIIHAMFDGLKPAVIAIIASALIKISKKSLTGTLQILIALSSFIALFFFNIPFPLIIIGAIVIGFIVQKVRKEDNASSKKDLGQIEEEKSYYLNTTSVLPHTKFKVSRAIKTLVLGLVLWILPLGLIYLALPEFSFWRNLTLFFTQAALVTFGGAYAVLPYVAQITVAKFGWLTHLEMIDGLALGETTPGPLIMVLAFVGFMGGYTHFHSSILYGSIALIVTTYYTFLPCFLYIFIGAPVIENSQNNIQVKTVLGMVTAAVVGVLLNLTVYLFKAVVFPNGFALTHIDYIYLAWVVISFIALTKYKANMILWIGISAVLGIILFLVK